MATYAVGDIQGCAIELERLLELVGFGAGDQLWAVGDLVNRGADSLSVLRRLKDLGNSVRVVLGNHDLHLLAMGFGGHPQRRGDTLGDVLAAPDREELLHWLRRQPLLHRDSTLGSVMTHAGIPHIWSLDEAGERAAEVEAVLRGDHFEAFLANLYGNEPDCWSPELEGLPRIKLITNYFTRMRLIRGDGRLDFKHKGAAADAPAPFRPWYEFRAPGPERLLFGHWAALEPIVDRSDVVNLDTGCVWGRRLTALRLEDARLFSVAASATD